MNETDSRFLHLQQEYITFYEGAYGGKNGPLYFREKILIVISSHIFFLDVESARNESHVVDKKTPGQNRYANGFKMLLRPNPSEPLNPDVAPKADKCVVES